MKLYWHNVKHKTDSHTGIRVLGNEFTGMCVCCILDVPDSGPLIVDGQQIAYTMLGNVPIVTIMLDREERRQLIGDGEGNYESSFSVAAEVEYRKMVRAAMYRTVLGLGKMYTRLGGPPVGAAESKKMNFRLSP